MIGPIVGLTLLDKEGLALAQHIVTKAHYLHAPVDPRCSPTGYSVSLDTWEHVGFLLFGRPESTRCYPWYGSVADVQSGRCELTRWQVLNLARVWFSPDVQPGGMLYDRAFLPHFTDRRGQWRSTLASTAIGLALDRIGFDYLMRRPPVYLDEPYEIRDVLSYCDPEIHRGTIYRASGFELARTNERGLQTWRKAIRPLTRDEHARIHQRSHTDPRAIQYRGRRSQLAFPEPASHRAWAPCMLVSADGHTVYTSFRSDDKK